MPDAETKHLAIRTVAAAQSAEASAVVRASFSRVGAAGWEPHAVQAFMAESLPERLAERLTVAAYASGAFVARQMVGFLLMPGPSVLGMLFVHPDWLRRRIGQRLWERARAFVESECPQVKTVELNATPSSVAFYRAVGFAPLSAEFMRQGCRATRMACWLPARTLGAELA